VRRVTGSSPDSDGGEQDAPSDPEAVARSVCLQLLTQRARSRSELTKALAKRGLPDDAASRVLDRFVEVGLIDDSALALSMAGAAHAERGLARRAVAVRLRNRGLGEDDVIEALATIDPQSEREQAQRLARKKLRSLGSLDPAVQTRRLAGLLARKGYPPSLVYDVVRQVMAEVGSEVESADPDGPLG
jgi:regulatory protein